MVGGTVSDDVLMRNIVYQGTVFGALLWNIFSVTFISCTFLTKSSVKLSSCLNVKIVISIVRYSVKKGTWTLGLLPVV